MNITNELILSEYNRIAEEYRKICPGVPAHAVAAYCTEMVANAAYKKVAAVLHTYNEHVLNVCSHRD